MAILGFYRIYASLGAGVLVYVFVGHHGWFAIACAVAFRSLWYSVERLVDHAMVEKCFKLHRYEFKQQLGPYGIRMANKAESDYHLKKSLAEVFIPDMKKLQKTADQLKVLDTLFGAGMRPDPESWQLHDCKLKYASYRLERHRKKFGE
jgi:hypothetical protein